MLLINAPPGILRFYLYKMTASSSVADHPPVPSRCCFFFFLLPPSSSFFPVPLLACLTASCAWPDI